MCGNDLRCGALFFSGNPLFCHEKETESGVCGERREDEKEEEMFQKSSDTMYSHPSENT